MTVINTMIPTVKERNVPNFMVKDPLSALTHFIAYLLSIIAMPFLIMKGAKDGINTIGLISLSIFALSVIFLYGASTSYHSFNVGNVKNKKLKKLDHAMIGILIAGTYTPLCIIKGVNMLPLFTLSLVWCLAFVVLIFKLFWVDCPKWVSSLLYLLMGWSCIPMLPSLFHTLDGGFKYLLLGGISYTIGAIVYALRIPFLERNKNFKSHELFHVFIMIGTLFHYILIYSFVA